MPYKFQSQCGVKEKKYDQKYRALRQCRKFYSNIRKRYQYDDEGNQSKNLNKKNQRKNQMTIFLMIRRVVSLSDTPKEWRNLNGSDHNLKNFDRLTRTKKIENGWEDNMEQTVLSSTQCSTFQSSLRSFYFWSFCRWCPTYITSSGTWDRRTGVRQMFQ